MTKDKTILIKNIFYMLSYAYQALKQEKYKDIDIEPFDRMYDLFAAILAKGIGIQLKQGLYREYTNIREELAIMRGKINMQETIKNQLSRKQRLTCDFDELSENNLLNQIIKTTVMILLRNAKVKDEHKNDLKKKMLFFSNVDIIEPGLIPWSSIRFQRNNKTYRMLINICQLVIQGMLMTTDSGEYKIATFVDEQNMHRLYEKFILEYYRAEHPQIKATASQIEWQVDDGVNAMLPIMQTDITLEYNSKILIIDAKYYSRTTSTKYGKATIHSGNLYQIFTYVKNKAYELKDKGYEVSGMLLYAKTDEEIYPNNTYNMSGNRISVKTLDLNVPFAEIKKQLDDIVEEYS